MTKTEMGVVTIGVAICAPLLYALFELGWPGSHRTVVVTPDTLPTFIGTTRLSGRDKSPTGAAAPFSNSTEAELISALLKNAKTVPDQALLRLSGMVNIGNSLNALPDKEAWGCALPVARKMMNLPCDCGQRNWLSHFVEMGDYALADSENEYLDSARLMLALGRNNAQEPETPARLRSAQ